MYKLTRSFPRECSVIRPFTWGGIAAVCSSCRLLHMATPLHARVSTELRERILRGDLQPGEPLPSEAQLCEEFGISRGRLLPRHHVFMRDEIPDAARQALQDSLVLVHGGMAQNVGPILEMVTEKYLLRSAAEWQGRKEGYSKGRERSFHFGAN